ncbi:Cystathionine beta-synthase, core [Cynara cardunculus var. scolymus]|uniref:Cystathionine beta-synthase, core n=1 Tax=Cynara cardunculus var. scolymus TaxID=59895 RepID=A0A103XNR7_CYNCS|nr:Cystathionine beta-synthase, core [Cynara cardunculus var. scolymus]
MDKPWAASSDFTLNTTPFLLVKCGLHFLLAISVLLVCVCVSASPISIVKNAVLQHVRLVNPLVRPLTRLESTSAARIEEHGFESTTISDNKLITVTPDTKVLKAMQLMTDNRIRHIPVIDDKEMLGMVSIGDVVRAVVSEHREELDRLNAFIQGGY